MRDSKTLAAASSLPLPDAVRELVERFDRNLSAYRSGGYNETQVRREFVDPFFGALGWDIDNRQGYAEPYKDVVHEDAVKIGSATKAPDYSFRIGGVRTFFVEAKKPAVSIKGEPGPAYQIRRYAWSAKLPLSVLTDFEELAIYDCRIKPSRKDAASVARVFYCRYEDYERQWPYLSSILSRDAVLKGSFDKHVATAAVKHGTAEVDVAFLQEIESWRKALATNIASCNRKITKRDLNFAVQRIIDRLVFLRIAEDRGTEDYGRLRRLLTAKDIYRHLGDYFQSADDKYNSGLFHFTAERDRSETPDRLTLGLKVEDAILKRIISGLYYPDSPYEFSVLPVEILGQVYEQFLGSVIRLTPSRRAVIEEKPEVKKAGGVYYTPKYIVDYMVRSTVGAMLRGKSPKDASKLRVLDPACGSGSFLIGAYSYLLDWHRDWYVANDPTKRTDEVYKGPGAAWYLTTAEKKRILLNSIHGVDIDDQAVEVTKLSLLLKVLEGESGDSLSRQRRLFHTRALPDLGKNVKCGNSLIGTDYLKGHLFPDEEERQRVNPFDWPREFPTIIGKTDFDVVLGNPPYVNAWELWEAMPSVREYVNEGGVYATAARHWDLYVLFLEKALSLCATNGYVSFIIPFSYAIQKYGIVSRQLLLRSHTLESIADLRTVRVFGPVPVITIIPVIAKRPPEPAHEISIVRPGPRSTPQVVHDFTMSHTVRQEALLSQHEQMLRLDLTPEAERIVQKIRSRSVTLGQLCYVNYGAQMSSKKQGAFGKEHVIRVSKVNRHCRPMISGRELYRYRTRWAGRFVDYSYADRMYGPRWPEFFELPKVMIRDVTGTHRIESTYDEERFYCDHTILCALRWCDVASWKTDASGGDPTLSRHYSTKLLAGIVGSSVVSFVFNMVLTGEGVRTGGAFHTYPQTIREFPIAALLHGAHVNTTAAQRIEHLVDRLRELGGKIDALRTDRDKARLRREFEAADGEIDDLLADFFGLTRAEATHVRDWRPVGEREPDDAKASA